MYNEFFPRRTHKKHAVITNCRHLTYLERFTENIDPSEFIAVHILLDGYDKTNTITTNFANSDKRTIMTYTSQNDLAIAMRYELNNTMQTIYIYGDEAFIWSMANSAKRFGIDPAIDNDIVLSKCGSIRNVYCAHCGTVNVVGYDGQITCAGCNTTLSVREHFSQRIGAYLGVRTYLEKQLNTADMVRDVGDDR